MLASALRGRDGDEPARAIIAEQDREIAEKSGVPRPAIKSIRRAGTKELTGPFKAQRTQAPLGLTALSRRPTMASPASPALR